jgi:signal transduction histidine kinase
VGRRLQIDRVVLRVAAAYTAIAAVVLLALGAAAFAYIARIDADILHPIMDLPDGTYVYRHALVQAGIAIGVAEVVLLVVVALAAYALAFVSTRPLREARERERRFAAEAAHELRTPLARIATAAQAARGLDSGEQERALDAIATMAIGASALIGDLLTLARVEHVASAVAEPVDLVSTARDVVAAFASTHPQIPITVCAGDGAFVVGDAPRLHRMLANLVDNAVRHASTRVTVDIAQTGARAVIAVEDDGSGVDAERREEIFERFVTTTAGTGLGLPICRWIARAHGGDVRITERSRFVVDLPAAPDFD